MRIYSVWTNLQKFFFFWFFSSYFSFLLYIWQPQNPLFWYEIDYIQPVCVYLSSSWLTRNNIWVFSICMFYRRFIYSQAKSITSQIYKQSVFINEKLNFCWCCCRYYCADNLFFKQLQLVRRVCRRWNINNNEQQQHTNKQIYKKISTL